MNEHDPDDETLLRVLLEQVARRGETSPMDLELAAAWVASPDPAAAALGRYQMTEALLPTVLALADRYAQRAAGRARPARLALGVLDDAVVTWQPSRGLSLHTWFTWHARHAITSDLRRGA